jgi:hypothetical protein
MRWWRRPPTVVDAAVTPDTDQYAAGAACLRRGYRWTFTYTDCAQHRRLDLYYTVDMPPSHQCCARFVHRELSADALVAPTHQRLSMLLVTPDRQYAAGRRPCLRRGYRLDIYYTIVQQPADWTIPIRWICGFTSVLRQVCPRELSADALVAPTTNGCRCCGNT